MSKFIYRVIVQNQRRQEGRYTISTILYVRSSTVHVDAVPADMSTMGEINYLLRVLEVKSVDQPLHVTCLEEPSVLTACYRSRDQTDMYVKTSITRGSSSRRMHTMHWNSLSVFWALISGSNSDGTSGNPRLLLPSLVPQRGLSNGKHFLQKHFQIDNRHPCNSKCRARPKTVSSTDLVYSYCKPTPIARRVLYYRDGWLWAKRRNSTL